MTLIVGFMKNECPILMGDILISNTTDLSTELVVPTTGKISSQTLTSGEYKPSALSQKINLLSPKLAIAWSGNLLDAQEFMRELIGAGLHNNPSRKSIIDIYNDISPSKLSILGILRDGKNMVLFDINSKVVIQPDTSFKWFKAAGSGFDSLSTIAPELRSAIIGGQINKLESGISTAMEMATGLLSRELDDVFPLQDLFGAGYEVLHPLGNGLAKFTDLTYCFWKAEENEPGKWYISFPFLAMKYSYSGDILVIRSVRLSSDQQRDICKIDSDELHIIKPIYRIVNDNELIGYKPPSLNSKMICNVFLWKNFSQQIGSFSTFGRYVTQAPPLIWSNEFKQNEGIDINLEFLRETITKISSLFSSNSLV